MKFAAYHRQLFRLVAVYACLALSPLSYAIQKEASENKPAGKLSPPTDSMEPRVARVQMRLNVNKDSVDVIEKGDLLTVLEDRENGYLVQTFTGIKGLVAKPNAVSLAEASEIYSEMISDLEKSAKLPDVDLKKTAGRLHTLRAGSLWASGKAEEAKQDFDKAIDLGYTAPHAYMSRGLFYAAQGKFREAITDYDKAIEQSPKDIALLINRAAAFMSIPDFSAAIQDYSQAIEIQKDNPLLYQQRAIAFKASQKFDEAIKDFTQAIQISGAKSIESVSSYMGRGFLYFQLGKHEQAAQDFGQVIEINPKASVAYNNRGYNLHQTGQSVSALRDYDKAIELEPTYALAYQNKAWLLATTDNTQLRKPKAAVEAALKACELTDYQDISNIAALAASYAAMDEFDKAVGWQEKVIEKTPGAQKPIAEKILQLYQDKKPFDAKVVAGLSSESEKTAEPRKNASPSPAKVDPVKPAPPKKRPL